MNAAAGMQVELVIVHSRGGSLSAKVKVMILQQGSISQRHDSTCQPRTKQASTQKRKYNANGGSGTTPDAELMSLYGGALLVAAL